MCRTELYGLSPPLCPLVVPRLLAREGYSAAGQARNPLGSPPSGAVQSWHAQADD
jgi:hypothetical protein